MSTSIKIEKYLNEVMFDVRSLALFRIVLGFSLLYNVVLVKYNYVKEFWGGSPIIPQAVFQEMNGVNSFSIFDWIRNDSFAYIYFWVLIGLIVFYTIGYRVKYVAPVVTFLFWNTLQATGSFIFGFDFFTFQLLFWSCFLPVANHWSVQREQRIVSSYFSFVLLVQIGWIYFSTGWAKYGLSWMEGYAVRNMLMDKMAVSSWAQMLADSPTFYKPATYVTLVIERLFPLFIFIPSRKDWLRYIAVLFLLVFHVMIFACYNVANFSISGIAVALLLLPTSFWVSLKFPVHKETLSNQLRPRLGVVFALLAIFIISYKNVFFLIRYSSIKENDRMTSWVKKVDEYDLGNPIKVSFFTQFWKMFSPNPPVKGGWLALERKMPNGTYQDFFTAKPIYDPPVMNWKPTGMEYYLLMYSRTFDFPDGSGDKFKIFLKYWLLDIKKENNLTESDLNSLYLTDYLFIIADQSAVVTPDISYNMYSAAELVNTNYKKIIDD